VADCQRDRGRGFLCRTASRYERCDDQCRLQMAPPSLVHTSLLCAAMRYMRARECDRTNDLTRRHTALLPPPPRWPLPARHPAARRTGQRFQVTRWRGRFSWIAANSGAGRVAKANRADRVRGARRGTGYSTVSYHASVSGLCLSVLLRECMCSEPCCEVVCHESVKSRQ